MLDVTTGAPHAIFRREHGELFLARRKNRPMFFIDIAVPRDVDPELNKLDGIFVYDIDDLQSAVTTHVADRRNEARAKAETPPGVNGCQAQGGWSTGAGIGSSPGGGRSFRTKRPEELGLPAGRRKMLSVQDPVASPAPMLRMVQAMSIF